MFYSLAKFLIGTYVRLRFRYSVTGLDRVPSRGRIIVAANHHSNWDPIFVGIGINRPLRFMAKMELFQQENFLWFRCVPGQPRSWGHTSDSFRISDSK